MNLVIDIGNTSSKAAIFDCGKIVEVITNYELRDTSDFEHVIYVSTRGAEPGFEGLTRLDHTTPTPVKNLYDTPSTLGYDRLAAAVGAHTLYPGSNVLIVDFGTAITFDLVTKKGEFLGGNISPGAHTRFRALHDYTGTLPLMSLPETAPEFPARNTKDAIACGVTMGIVAETEGYIARAKEHFTEINVLFTGGDANYFAGHVKFPIFVVSDLVLYGLNAILEHNI